MRTANLWIIISRSTISINIDTIIFPRIKCCNKKRYIHFYLNIYLCKGASCNIAGDGPQTQWDQFVSSGIILSTDTSNIYVGMYNSGGGDCFYYSILQLTDLFSSGIVTVTDLRFALWYFAVNHQSELSKEIYEAFRTNHDNDSYEVFIENIKKPHEWACSRIIVIMSNFLQMEIIVITNELNSADRTTNPGLFKTSTAFNDRLSIPSDLVIANNQEIYIYQHLYENPLVPAPLIQLNHFCALRRRPRKPCDYSYSFVSVHELNVFIVNNGSYKDYLINLNKTQTKRKKVYAKRKETSSSKKITKCNKNKLLSADQSIFLTKMIGNEDIIEKETKRKQYNAERMAKYRSTESPQQSDKRKNSDSANKKEKIINETIEGKNIRLKQHSDCMAKNRDTESPLQSKKERH